MQVRQRVGLAGWPVRHSVSPAMYNAAFAALDLDWVYELLPTPPDQLENTVASLPVEHFRGANVTVPHKQAVVRLVHDLSAAARTIGAVNTIVVRHGRLWGHNTDAEGFTAALDETGFRAAGCRALLLGAGGAARAVAHELLKAGCCVTIHSRSSQRVARLARDLDPLSGVSVHMLAPGAESLASLPHSDVDLVVNATPVGMWPRTDDSPWPDGVPLSPNWVVFDLVYNPASTKLLGQAREAGARAIGGLGMLVHQAARSFELWTGVAAPAEIMRAAAQRALDKAAVSNGA